LKTKIYIFLLIILLFNLLIINQVFAEEKTVNNDVYETLSEEIIHVESVFLSGNYSAIFLSDKLFNINVNVWPSNATDKSYILTNSNDNILTIDENGFITPVSPGESIIKIVTNDGGYTSTKKIIILPDPPIEFIDWKCKFEKIHISYPWTIKFNKPIKMETINWKNIYMIDSNFNIIPVKIYSETENTLKICVIDSQIDTSKDNILYLYITKGITDKNDKPLNENVRMTIKLRKNL